MTVEPAPRRFEVVLVRHGETDWSASSKHTGVSNIPLNAAGREAARRIGPRLAKRTFVAVWTSPRARAQETCALAGFGARARIVSELAEWDYGEFEGRTTEEIRVRRPRWTVWTDGCPGGESLVDVGARAERVIAELRELAGDAVLFSHGHFSRALAARWLGLGPEMGRCFALAAGAISVLGWERETPVVQAWNERP